jgi:hypothetical protein
MKLFTNYEKVISFGSKNELLTLDSMLIKDKEENKKRSSF